MRSRIVRIIFPVLLAGILQAQVRAPQIGVIRSSDGSVRAVYGLAANFILASKPIATADTVSFSDRAGLIAANGRIQLVKPDGTPVGEYESHETKPVLNVDTDAASAIAWLPSEHAILRWTGAKFQLFPIAPVEGRVTSLKADGTNRAQLLVLDDDGSTSRATIALSTGELVSLDIVAGASGPAFAQQAALISHELSHEQKELVIEFANGMRQHLPVPGDVVIERMSSEWLHLSSPATNQHWALHVAGSQVDLFVLPGLQLSEEVAK